MCKLVVANIAEIYKAYKTGNYKPMDANKDLYSSPVYKKCTESLILILICYRTESEERIEGRIKIKICEWVNISEINGGVYVIVCLTEYELLHNIQTQFQIVSE
ncbi:uncharacterized protein LOC133796631 [Humulus lupulus]|uniref:uncharacterized protein LOC133796631 n=1 Tax=Humulus lupulus TaxID=3486 RepID=UPI002B40EB8A|nr:uncharacterized protein LOC133796631 [Humulus lupulus]